MRDVEYPSGQSATVSRNEHRNVHPPYCQLTCQKPVRWKKPAPFSAISPAKIWKKNMDRSSRTKYRTAGKPKTSIGAGHSIRAWNCILLGRRGPAARPGNAFRGSGSGIAGRCRCQGTRSARAPAQTPDHLRPEHTKNPYPSDQIPEIDRDIAFNANRHNYDRMPCQL